MSARRLIAALAAPLTIVLLAACSSGSTEGTADLSTPKSSTSPTPTIDPGPVQLTEEEAAERYLNIVCPTNAKTTALNAAFKAGEEEFLGGGAPDPSAVRAAAQAQLEARQREAELFEDDYLLWPDQLRAHVTAIRDSDVATLGALSAIVNAPDYESAYYAAWPDATAAQASAQEIRFQLNIGADTEATCVGHENGHDLLLKEKEEREAALSDQE